MTFAELVDAVSEKTGYPREETRVICEELLNAMLARLAVGGDVRIRRLGTFFWKELAARNFKMPGREKEVEAPARLRLLFRPALRFRKGPR